MQRLKVKRLKVLLCGSHYGRSYLPALEASPPAYELVGLLARGSLRSQELAAELRIPLVRSVSELRGTVDIACAALGVSGCGQVLELLERSTSVLCEHPQSPQFLQSAFDVSARRGVGFHVNAHFAYLKAPAAFVDASQQCCRVARPLFLDVMLTDRAMYAALDILRRAIGSCQVDAFSRMSRSKPFTILRGRLAGIPTTFQIQESFAADGERVPDSSPAYLVDCRLTLGFSTGILSLGSIHGPVIWNSAAVTLVGPESPLWEDVQGSGAPIASAIAEQRTRANRQALDALVRQMQGQMIPDDQTPGHVLEVASAWDYLGRFLTAS